MSAPTHSFRLLLRVRYPECDQQGIVFNSRYAEYADLLMSELVRAAFGSYRAMLEEHLDTHVVRYLIEWSSGARFDDVLSLTITRLDFGNTSFTSAIDIRRESDGAAVAKVEVVNVMMDTRSGAKTRIPASAREKLRAALSGATVDFSGGLGPAVPHCRETHSSKEKP